MRIRGSDIGAELNDICIKQTNRDIGNIAGFIGVKEPTVRIELSVMYYWISTWQIRTLFKHPHDSSVISPIDKGTKLELRRIGIMPSNIDPLIQDRFDRYNSISNQHNYAETHDTLAWVFVAICFMAEPHGVHPSEPDSKDVTIVSAMLIAFSSTVRKWLDQFRPR